jgi:hypothetical protein
MRTPLALSASLLLAIFGVRAQNSPDCRSAIPVCADTTIVAFADGGGDIDDFDPDVITQTGCLEKAALVLPISRTIPPGMCSVQGPMAR